MQAHFNSHTLAEIFRDLYISERRGVLTLANDDVEERIFLDRGLICYAESNGEDGELGARLIREGRISTGALAEARQNIDSSAELGHILVTRDLVSREALNRALSGQIDELIGAAFRWEGGSARFADGPAMPATIEGDTVTTAQFILNGISGMARFDALREALIGVDRPLRLQTQAPVSIERMTLTPTQGFILSRLGGSTTFKDVVSLVPPGEEQGAARFIYGLLVLGAVGFDPPISEGPFRVSTILREHADRRALEQMQERTIEQTYANLSRQGSHDVLGVERDASPDNIERAYAEAKTMFGPERILPSVRSKMKTELGVIESRLVEAYVKLSQPVSEEPHSRPSSESPEARDGVGVDDLLVRMELDKTTGKLALEKANKVAETYFGQARKALREGDFHNAIQYGKLAISYNDKDARYYFLLAECQVRNPGARWQHLAEQNYTKATQIDPWNVEYFVCLGRFYKRRGLKLRARKLFEEALRLHPQHEVVTRELRGLE